MRPTLQDIINREWNESANLPDGEKPKVYSSQFALELARYYEQDGRTPQQREDTLKADVWTLFYAYSCAIRKEPRYWKPEPLRCKDAYNRMAVGLRLILCDLLALVFDMGLSLPQDELKRYDGIELWVQDIMPFVPQLYGGNTGLPKGDEASTQGTAQQSQKDGTEGQQPAANVDEASIPTIYDINTVKGSLEKAIYKQALHEGYIRLNGNNTYTNGCITLRLIAYMCGRIYCRDRVKEDENGDDELFKGSNFPAKEVQTLFNGADIANHRDQFKTPPLGHSKIDKLFDNMKNKEASH